MPKFDVIRVTESDLTQEVNFTGRVTPAQNITLALEVGGKIARVYAVVGQRVGANTILAELENAESLAQLAQAKAGVASARAQRAQYEAAFKTQEAKLRELIRGTRPEEIQLAETKVSNADKALADARTNLENTKQRAAIDLTNLYDGIEDIITDAHTKSDDAVRKQTDEMFTDDESNNPQLTFISSNSQAETNAESDRLTAGNALKNLKIELDAVSSLSTQSALDQTLNRSEAHLVIIRNFLTALYSAINSATGISQTTINTHKGNTNTALTNINTAAANISGQKQLIAAQLATNQTNIDVAQSKVTDSENVLRSAEDELLLKKAGPTAEQIDAQEAQVAQAEANIASQHALIAQAEANTKVIEAQIEKAILRSPIGGVVTVQNAKAGEIVGPNQPLISLISEAQFEIEANVPETDISKIRIGDAASITLDAYGNDAIFQANITAIDPAETIVDGVTTYTTTLQFNKEDERIKSGMTANIDIVTDRRENVLIAPQRSVIRKNGDKVLRILLDNGNIQERKIETGLRGSDGNIEITAGVQEGEQIIVSEK